VSVPTDPSAFTTDWLAGVLGAATDPDVADPGWIPGHAGGGALVFRESDPNPLVTRKSAAVTWYVSFSFDLNLLKGFAG
jgi:hypothetical protein